MRRGVRTSEFWLCLAAVLSVFAYHPGGDGWPLAASAAVAAVGIGANAYLVAKYVGWRCQLKAGVIQYRLRRQDEDTREDVAVSGDPFGFAQRPHVSGEPGEGDE